MSRIVPTYTERQLTKQSDRLIAISAVATRLGQRLEDTPSFGLWQGRMTEQLGWYTYGPKKCVSGTPTWSWASVDGCIHYDAEPII